jgi:hypothetical protein
MYAYLLIDLIFILKVCPIEGAYGYFRSAYLKVTILTKQSPFRILYLMLCSLVCHIVCRTIFQSETIQHWNEHCIHISDTIQRAHFAFL